MDHGVQLILAQSILDRVSIIQVIGDMAHQMFKLTCHTQSSEFVFYAHKTRSLDRRRLPGLHILNFGN